MLLDRPFRDPKLMGNAGIRTALGHQREHLALARGKNVERVLGAAGGDQLLDERWIDDRPSLDDSLDSLDELVDVRDPALQQVARALAAGQQVRRLLDLDMSGKNEDRGFGELLPNLVRGIETFVRVAGWHPDVDNCKIGLVLPNERHQPRSVVGLADDLEAGSLEQARQTLAEEDVVVGEDNPLGTLAHPSIMG